jgi:hypothetical protein
VERDADQFSLGAARSDTCRTSQSGQPRGGRATGRRLLQETVTALCRRGYTWARVARWDRVQTTRGEWINGVIVDHAFAFEEPDVGRCEVPIRRSSRSG